MIYLLDTNVCIGILNGRNHQVRQRLAATSPSTVVLCSIVQAELYRGAYRSSQREANLTLLNHFFSQFQSIPFDTHAAEMYGRIRANLEAQGALIGPYDLLIAAIALAHHLTLVTHNVREFGRVSGLTYEDWEAGP